jgi:hypothetical protein
MGSPQLIGAAWSDCKARLIPTRACRNWLQGYLDHLTPLVEIGYEYTAEPVRDLRPVCANCHMILHRREAAYSLDEVRSMLDVRGDQRRDRS